MTLIVSLYELAIDSVEPNKGANSSDHQDIYFYNDLGW